MQLPNHTDLPTNIQDLIPASERARDQRHALEPRIDTMFDANRSQALDGVIALEARLVSCVAVWALL
jgi:hypothetical protein